MPEPSPDIETGSGISRKFTRREFLFKLPAILYGITQPEAPKPVNNILSIETPEARYFPIYEWHPRPASKEELKLLPLQDIFFYEYNEDSRNFVNHNTPPQVILDTPSPTILQVFPGSKRTYLIPRDHLEWLKENNTKVSFEGYTIPNGLLTLLLTTGTKSLEGSIGAGIVLSLARSKMKSDSTKEFTRRQFLKVVAGLAAAWGLSPSISWLMPHKTEVRLNAWERIIIKAHGLSSQMHPENPIIFFRNIMFARKLQFLGGVMSKEKGRKAHIAYNVGSAHGGIEDFLHIGKDWTLAFLNIIPNQYLRAVIDANGGFENFCSNVIFDPNAQTRSVLVDQELKSFLRKKLDQSDHS